MFPNFWEQSGQKSRLLALRARFTVTYPEFISRILEIFSEQFRKLTRLLVLQGRFTVTYSQNNFGNSRKCSQNFWEQFRDLTRILALQACFTVTYSEIIRNYFGNCLGTIFEINQDFSSSGPFYCTYISEIIPKFWE